MDNELAKLIVRLMNNDYKGIKVGDKVKILNSGKEGVVVQTGGAGMLEVLFSDNERIVIWEGEVERVNN